MEFARRKSSSKRGREATNSRVARPIAGHAGKVLDLQRTVGNAAVCADLRSVQRDGAKGAPDVIGGVGNLLRDWKREAYAGVDEAVTGKLEQTIKEATSFNTEALAGAILGNVMWALASFATGGVAFAISLAGIAVGAATQVPAGSEPKTPVARIQEAMYQALDEIDTRAKTAARDGVNEATAQGRTVTLPEILRRLFVSTQLDLSVPSSPEIVPAAVRAAYRESAEHLFATYASEVDPIGSKIDMSGPDPFVEKHVTVRLIYVNDFGYADAHRPKPGVYDNGWVFDRWVSPEVISAAKTQAKTSGQASIPTVPIIEVTNVPTPIVTPKPVAPPPVGFD